MLLVDPGCTTVVRDSDPVDKGIVDSDDPLLPPRRCRPEPANVVKEGMVNLTKVNIEVG